MPHAVDQSNMGEPMTNGEKPAFKVLDHITSYPVVNDSISTFQSNPYGQKSINLATGVFDRFGKPIVPYLRGPYSYVAPYVGKADSLADSGLSKVDGTFPIVKEDTQKIKGTFIDYASFPFKVAGETRNYALKTWGDEYKKTDGEGIFKLVKAAISTDLKFMQDAYFVAFEYFNKSKETAKAKTNEKTSN